MDLERDPSQPARPPAYRWLQLAAGILGMVAVTNLQYSWTFFVEPLHQRFPSWPTDEIQVAFTLFVLAETWLVPIEAYLADRFGPRWMLALGGVLVALSWTMNSRADSLAQLYLGNILGGAGAGIVYGISIGSALKWFPDRRGLAAGLTAAAFGAGSALTVEPIIQTIKHHGYQNAFLWFGIGQGLVVLLASLILRTPRPGEVPPPRQWGPAQSQRDFTPGEVLRTPLFWLMYLMMTLATVGGLMAISQLDPMARSYHLADKPIVLFGFTIAAVALAAEIDRVLNGFTRPICGWISDHIGREVTMFIAFSLEGVAIFLWMHTAHISELFVIFSGLTFFAWGEIYSLFPALCGDLFGRKFASTNYALLYTAKGTAALFVPLGSYLHESTGSWAPIFGLAIAFDLTVALLALFVLKPLRQRWLTEAKPVNTEALAPVVP